MGRKRRLSDGIQRCGVDEHWIDVAGSIWLDQSGWIDLAGSKRWLDQSGSRFRRNAPTPLE
jgi:hypothetical protein